MHSLQEATGGNEPVAPEYEQEPEPVSIQLSTAGIAKWARLVGIIYLFAFLVAIWESDELRLHTLNGMVKVLQLIARTVGALALRTEQSYNEYVNALH